MLHFFKNFNSVIIYLAVLNFIGSVKHKISKNALVDLLTKVVKQLMYWIIKSSQVLHLTCVRNELKLNHYSMTIFPSVGC